MTTIEKNRIICLFMGLRPKLESPDVYSFSDSPWFSTRGDDPGKVMDDIANYAKYHSDWNWLCLVIEKIELMSHTGFMGTVQMFGLGRTRINCYQSEILRKEIDIIGERYGINPTHEAVFQFIVWYNQQQKL